MAFAPIPQPTPGAVVVTFDVAAAESAVTALQAMAEGLDDLRTAEANAAHTALAQWKGSARTWFEHSRSGISADVASAKTAIQTVIDQITLDAAAAAQAQLNANATADAERARAAAQAQAEADARAAAEADLAATNNGG